MVAAPKALMNEVQCPERVGAEEMAVPATSEGYEWM
jgi:hypothetical protein